MANMLDFKIIISEFELESRQCIHFRTNALKKIMNLLIPHLQL